MSHDELAGVVDLYGALTRSELERALEELAFKRGDGSGPTADDVDDAVDAYALVAIDPTDAGDVVTPAPEPDDDLLIVGPAAFPMLPEHGEDLPHIMDVPNRAVDRDAVADWVVARLEREAATAVDEGDADRAATLLDVTYDLEAWADVDLADHRGRLDDVA